MPELNELRLAHTLGIFVTRVVEAVNTYFNRAVVGDGIDLKGAGNQFSGDFAADVVLDSLNGGLP